MNDSRQLSPWPAAFLWGLAAFAVLGAAGLVEAERMVRDGSHLRRLRLIAAIAPALFTALWAFHPAVLGRLRRLPAGQASGLAVALVSWVVLLTAERFDPYAIVIVATAAGAAVYALRDGVPPGHLGAAGLAVWLLLWIPFDLRWYEGEGKHMALFLGERGSYAICSLLVTSLGVLAFGVVGRQEQGLRPPKRSDPVKAVIVLLAFGCLAIPIGLASGFLSANAQLSWGQAGLAALGIALTIALPEELFFRGILDSGLRRVFKAPWASLAVSSLAFGLMHWNNEHELKFQLAYLGLASAAGVFYGLAYRWSGGLLAPILVHTLTDLFWKAFLER